MKNQVKIKNVIQMLFGVLFLLFLISCSQEKKTAEQDTEKTGSGYYEISTSDLKTQLQEDDFVLVNVHIPYAGELPKTDVFIPYNQIEQNLDKLPQDKSAKIVVYCRGGHMSAIAAKTLTKLGYTHVYDLLGGMNAWEKEGNELIKK